jgi:hypothetical protein
MKLIRQLVVFMTLVGSLQIVQAEEYLKPHNYRQEVRDSLQELQGYLNKLIAYQEITPHQYRLESQRVQQVSQRVGSGASGEPMSAKERNWDFALMDQIQREAAGLADLDSARAYYGGSLTTYQTPTR